MINTSNLYAYFNNNLLHFIVENKRKERKDVNKKRWAFQLLIVLLFGLIFSHATAASAEKATDGELRVGMEAGYAPFNWTQGTEKNGAVAIEGDKEYAGGYDVEIAKIVAKKLNKKLVIVKTEWDGLPPALTSGKIDAIIAGMTPTAKRKKEVDFTNVYYKSQLVLLVRKNSQFAKAVELKDLAKARITGQLNTFHYNVIDQIPQVKKQPAMDNFPAMRVALSSGTIDGYVTEKPEAITAERVNPNFKMLVFDEKHGFKTNPEDTAISIGLKKGDEKLATINNILAGISQKERMQIMNKAIKNQPAAKENTKDNQVGNNHVIINILKQYGSMFARGAGMTLFLALIGTIIGTTIGLLIGMFRTMNEPEAPIKRGFVKCVNALLFAYIEIFRGTPMIVQAAVIYYGSAQAFGIDVNRTLAALVIVSVNTGAYMSEIVRGGIFAIDSGQFEAAQAIGMTHGQTMRKVILPQVIRNIMPATGNEFVINIKDTSVLSIISVSELFFQGKSAAGATYQFFPTYFIICVIYFIMTFIVTRILRLVEKHMDGPKNYTPYADQIQIQQSNGEEDKINE